MATFDNLYYWGFNPKNNLVKIKIPFELRSEKIVFHALDEFNGKLIFLGCGSFCESKFFSIQQVDENKLLIYKILSREPQLKEEIDDYYKPIILLDFDSFHDDDILEDMIMHHN